MRHGVRKKDDPYENEDSLDSFVRYIMYFSVFWLVLVALAILARLKSQGGIYPEGIIPPKKQQSNTRASSRDDFIDLFAKYGIPKEPLAPFGSYPNPWKLEITNSDFASIVRFPTIWVQDEFGRKSQQPNLQILDYGSSSSSDNYSAFPQLPAPPESTFSVAKRTVGRWIKEALQDETHGYESPALIGRYDEVRNNKGGGDCSTVGIELGGQHNTGARVFAFTDGTVVQIGAAHVILEHQLLLGGDGDGGDDKKNVVWALYSNLDSKSILHLSEGKIVQKGKSIGRLGGDKLYFQLSQTPPLDDDDEWPYCVPLSQRAQALRKHPDPRLVLGPLY